MSVVCQYWDLCEPVIAPVLKHRGMCIADSRGGKAVMALALNSELNKPLRSLISVDMSPAKGKISSECVFAPSLCCSKPVDCS